MKISKTYNKFQSKFIERWLTDKENDGTLKTVSIVLITVILFLISFYFFDTEFEKAKGGYRLLIVGIILAGIIVGLLYFQILYVQGNRGKQLKEITVQEIEKNTSFNKNELDTENSTKSDDKIIATNQGNSSNNDLKDIFEEFAKNGIYEKGKETFGLESFGFESKTQLAVILNVIKFNSHKHKFSNVTQNKFLMTFKESFKNCFSLEDKEFKDKIDFTESYFSNIKKDLFEFDKMNNSISQLNKHSQFYQLYNEFSKILIAKDI